MNPFERKIWESGAEAHPSKSSERMIEETIEKIALGLPGLSIVLNAMPKESLVALDHALNQIGSDFRGLANIDEAEVEAVRPLLERFTASKDAKEQRGIAMELFRVLS